MHSQGGLLSQLWCELCCVGVSPQIHSECKRFGKAYNLRSVAVYGGGSMWEQAKALQEGAEIVVCTPVSTKPGVYTVQLAESCKNLFL